MKTYARILLLFFVSTSLAACRVDEAPGSYYVDPIDLHLTYADFGVTRPFTHPLELTLANNSEQIEYRSTSDQWGKVRLEKLLPGEYAISVTGRLTADEVAEITGEPDAAEWTLTGYVSQISLRLGATNVIEGLALTSSQSGTVIFKELYYAGSRTPSDGQYRNDGFYSIHNNSKFPASLDDIYIGYMEHYGGFNQAPPLWPGEELGNYSHVYVKALWKIVREGESATLDPGQTAVIAVMAAPHNKDAQYNLGSPVDLSSADYEAYVEDAENPYPDFPAKNMQMTYWPDYSYLWRISVFGRGMVLIKASAEEIEGFEKVVLPSGFWAAGESEEYYYNLKVPNDYVIDAVDLIQNKTTSVTKLFPPSLDAGFATVEGIYLGKSVIRKVASQEDGIEILQDTNNSTADFEVNDTPLSR